MVTISKAFAPTTEQILNLDGVHRRADRFRFELCDKDLKAIGELHPDRFQSTPSIENDTKNKTSRRLRGLKLLRDEIPDINILTDRLRVYMILQNDVEFILGTFMWGDTNEPVRSWGIEQYSEMFDRSYQLDQKSTRAFGWGPGANIGQIIFFLFFRAGFELKDFAVLGDEANRGLAEPLAWNPGATWMDMLIDLGNLVGFAPPWFDRFGRMHFDNVPNPTMSPPTVPVYGNSTRVFKDSIVSSNDLSKAPNDFAVFDSGTGLLRTGRFELPSSAPHSFANRGFYIGEVQSVQGLENQAQADWGAYNLGLTAGVAYEWLAFDSTLDPRHDTFDITPIHPSLYASPDDFPDNWLEDSWSAELRSGGVMKHVVRRPIYAV